MQEQSNNNDIPIATMRLEEAQSLVRLYESYATPERMLQVLKSVNETAHAKLMTSMVDMLESEHESTFNLVREKLLADALEAEERRVRKNELQREKRANAKRRAECVEADLEEAGSNGWHVQ